MNAERPVEQALGRGTAVVKAEGSAARPTLGLLKSRRFQEGSPHYTPIQSTHLREHPNTAQKPSCSHWLLALPSSSP